MDCANDKKSNYSPPSADPQSRPFYSEEALERRIAYNNRRATENGPKSYGNEPHPFRAKELRALIRVAKLTRRQLQVVGLRSKGFTFDEIGRLLRTTKQAAHRICSQALRKLRRASRVYPFVGLNEVYRQEIHRGAMH